MALKEAYERMLVLVKDKLATAIAKDKAWDIEHYKNDICIIEQYLKEIL